jgi:ectoine hydroxylase-related dioxygenase (phytanoyl-CoA dioxygenase family)
MSTEVSYVPTKNPTVFLTDEEIQFFKENGYLVVPAITTQDEIEYLKPIYDNIFAEKRGRDRGDHFDLTGDDTDENKLSTPQVLWPSRYGLKLNETQYFANAFNISKQILGDDAYFGGDHAILKPPHTNTATPWHQDEAYWNPEKLYNSCAFWMPLQDVDESNGCMHFIPETHRLEVQNHHCFDNNNKIHGLEVDYLNPELEKKKSYCSIEGWWLYNS